MDCLEAIRLEPHWTKEKDSEHKTAEMDGGEYVEVKGEAWRSTYNHQRRPDPTLRTRNVLPTNRLTVKTSRYFTTDKSTKQLDSVIQAEEVGEPEPSKAKKYLSKNA